jgi:hypothetical protein
VKYRTHLRFRLVDRVFSCPQKLNLQNPCFLALTIRSKNPEKQGVFWHPKKHEKNIKKALALKTRF